jgi:hypothetical protein
VKDWKDWNDLANESQTAARICMKEKKPRAAINRAYYAAYQAATAYLHYRGGGIPPTIQGIQRDAWQHERLPNIIRTQLKVQFPHGDANQRNKIKGALSELYKLRIFADYVPSKSREFCRKEDADEVRNAIKTSGEVIKFLQAIFNEE